jgi:hypothetical protein
VLGETHDEHGTTFKIRASPETLAQIRKKLESV